MRKLLTFFGVILLVSILLTLMSGGDSPSSQPRATTTRQTPATSSYQAPEMFANIKRWTPTETDCTNLQSWFNGADNMHGRVSGDSAAMRWYTDLMIQVDARMETVGCYG